MVKNKEEIEAKSEEIAKEIVTVLRRHTPHPGVVFLAALVASLEVLADSIEKDGGPSTEKTINKLIEYTEQAIARRYENNA